MSRKIEHADEYILAAFLAGDLPSSLRKEIASYIAESDSARDLLTMAQQAMDVAETGDGAPYTNLELATVVPPRTSSRRTTAQPVIGLGSLWKVTALFASAVLVLTITVGILAFDNSGAASSSDGNWMPTVGAEQLNLSWPSQQDAIAYQILMMNTQTGEARVVSGTDQTEYSILAAELSAGEPSNVWILAIDADGDILSRSGSIAVRSN